MKKLMFIIVLGLCAVGISQTKVTGTVLDEFGLPIYNAKVKVRGTEDQTTTNFSGKFTLTSSKPLHWRLDVDSKAYVAESIFVGKAGDVGEIYLSFDINPTEFSVTASKAREKVVSSMASITVVEEAKLLATPVNGNIIESLRNVRGVNLLRKGTSNSNIELRGPLGLIGTNTLILKDFAPKSSIDDQRFDAANTALNLIDVERVEVVRGPSGALYGPNVTAGVINFITKNPFDDTGITVQTALGEQNNSSYALRYANNDGKQFGWKILAFYNGSTDFEFDELAKLNSLEIPLFTQQNWQTASGKTFENIDNSSNSLSNWVINAELEFRPSEGQRINYDVNLSNATDNYFGPGSNYLAGNQRYEQNLRFRSPEWFVSFYHRHDFGSAFQNTLEPNTKLANREFVFFYQNQPNLDLDGDGVNETQSSGLNGPKNYYDGSVQYSKELNEGTFLTAGLDAKYISSTSADFLGSFSAHNGGQNDFSIFGGYVSAKKNLSEKLVARATARIDHYATIDQSALSPTLGLVYSFSDKNAVRASFSRSYSSPTRQETWLDFTVPLPGFLPNTRIIGQRTNLTYDNPVTQFAFGQVMGADSFELQDIVNTLAQNAGVSSPAVSGRVNSQLQASYFTGPNSAGFGTPTGNISSLSEIIPKEVELSLIDQIEIGFTHKEPHFEFNADAYLNILERFNSSILASATPGTQLNLAEIQSEIESQVPASPERDALIDALYSTIAGPVPDGSLNSLPGYGLVRSDRAQALGYDFDTTIPSYGNKNAVYMGMELSSTYQIVEKLSVHGNYTYISKNQWTPQELGETNPTYGFFLNVPNHMANLGLYYTPKLGFYGSIFGNYQSAFESRHGDGVSFSGLNDARAVFDAKIGFRKMLDRSDTTFDLALSVQNLFDNRYSHFPNLPQNQRWAKLSLLVHMD